MGDRPSAGWKLGLVAGFAALLRADGAWWVAFTLGPAIALGLLRRDAKLWRPALVGTAISAGLFLAHLGWRYATYDDWLPHTARVKVGVSAHAAERGSSYLVHFLITFPGVVLALALGAVAARRPRVGAAYLIVLATAVYVVLVGGDFMAFGRFLVPLLPFAALVLAGGLAVLEGRFGRVAPAAAGLLSTALVLTPAFGVHLVPKALRTSCSVRHNRGDESRSRSELEQWQCMNLQAEEWLTLGEGLRMVSEPGDSLVYGAVGAIGWTSRLYLYDRNGLITPSVAKLPPQTEPPRSPGHDKTVSPEFFAQARPTYLFAAWIPAGAGRWQADVERTQNAQLIGYLRAGQLARKDLPQGEHPNPGHHLIVVPGR
ncbi:MAG: hypothetical protein O2816_02010 [Planctomycetota bacterium]|nr:hypothetical protein [Planctomycetota bacterium]